MPTIRKIGVLVSIIFLFMILPAQAEGVFFDRYCLNLSPLAGMLYGHAEEIVYKYPKKAQYLSELLWDLKPLFYIGIAADLGPRNPFQNSGLIAAGSFKFPPL